MRIDKVLFSCSAGGTQVEEYSSFWNMQSKIFRYFGIEPVCLLFGKISDTNMTEEHGTVIEMEYVPELPWVTQLTWSKFHHPTTEPDTTWLIGDMDCIPLNKNYFTTQIAHLPDSAYAHLNAGGISNPRMGIDDGFRLYGSQRHGADRGQVGTDVPAHYHVAKGKQFEIYTQGRPFLDQVRHIVESERYGLGPVTGHACVPADQKTSNEYWYYWCAEENYSSELLWNAIQAGVVDFHPFWYSNANDTQRIGRDGWNEARTDYDYSPDRVARKEIVDVHCVRPYGKQEQAFLKILELAGTLL